MHDLPHSYAICEGVMTQFVAGERVRCVDDDYGVHPGLKAGEEYVVEFHAPDTGLVWIEGLIGEWSPTRFEHVAYAAAAHDVLSNAVADMMVECQFCDNKIEPWHFVCKPCWDKGCRTTYHAPVNPIFNLPIDNCVKPSPKPQTDPRSEGIARAVGNLSIHEPRLGTARWEPK